MKITADDPRIVYLREILPHVPVTPRGYRAWKEYLTKNPEAIKRLGLSKLEEPWHNLNVFLKRVQKKGLFNLDLARPAPVTAAPAAALPEGVATHSPKTQKPYKPHQLLVLRIAHEYRLGTNTDWQRAFREHPDWKAELVKKYGTNLVSSASGLVSSHRKASNPKPKSAYVPVAQRRATNGNGAHHSEPAPQPAGPALNFCPHCGFPVGTVIKAVNAMNALGK